MSVKVPRIMQPTVIDSPIGNLLEMAIIKSDLLS